MGVPKRRQSSARSGKRQAHDSLKAPHYSYCPQCKEPVLPHHVCPKCGAYKGKEIIHIEEE